MQKINLKKRILRVKEIDLKKIQATIDTLEKKVEKNKKLALFLILGIFMFHILAVSFSDRTDGLDYFYALISGLGAGLFFLLINWMKGAGTIDSNPRLPGQTRL